MRALKIIGISLGSLIVLAILAIVAAALLINPNDYKGRIVQTVRQSTGRDLALPGDIHLSVFPWLALQLGPASLGNPPGFGVQPFVSLQRASLRVRVLPLLLHRRLQIGKVEIDGLDLRLLRNARGQGNWEGLGGGSSAAGGKGPSAGAAALSELGGLVIRNGRLSYQDMVADRVNLEVGRIASGATVPVDLQLQLITSQGATPTNFSSSLKLVPDLAAEHYQVRALQLKGALAARAGAPAVPWTLAVPSMDLDLKAQTVNVPQYSLRLATLQLSGAAHGDRIVDAPRVNGSFRVEPVSPREVMRQLGISVPATRDARALSRFAASGQLAYGGNAMRVSGLELQLDDSQLRGDLAVTNLTRKAVSFNLAIDHIDLDRYRSPEPPAGSKSAGAQPAASPAASSSQLPTDTLRALQMDGSLTIGALTLAGLKVSQASVKLAAHGGLTRIAPVSARLYGGSYTGDITLDARGAVPSLKLDQNLSDVDVAQLLKDFAHTGRLAGRGNVTASLTGRGSGSEAILRTLDGHVAANLANGAIEGIDLPFAVDQATALIQKHSLPTGGGTGRTSFQTFKASADVANGVATTRDLTISSQNVHVTGEGTLNLVSEAVNYQLQVELLRGGTSQGAVANIPLDVTGTLADLKVRPDLERLAKARVQQEINQRKGELKQKLQQKVEDTLKGLFNRPRPK